MKRLLSQLGVVGITIAFLTVCFSSGAVAAEKRKFGLSKKMEKILSEVNINDRTDHKYRISQWSRLDIFTEHSDPSLIGAEETSYGQSYRLVPMHPGDKVNITGYSATRSKDGDCYYTKFQATQIITAIPGGYSVVYDAETKIDIFGGTGKYLDVKGSGICRSKSTPTGEITKCEGEWEY